MCEVRPRGKYAMFKGTYTSCKGASGAQSWVKLLGSCKLIADANSRDEDLSDISPSGQCCKCPKAVSEFASLIRQSRLEAYLVTMSNDENEVRKVLNSTVHADLPFKLYGILSEIRHS